MKAWLITWEWGNDSAAVADQVVTVLNPHWGEARVLELVEALHAIMTSNVTQLANYAKRSSNNPCRGKSVDNRIVCGHNPWLEARQVSDLTVATDPAGLEVISWREPDRYALVDDRPQKVADGRKREFHRRVTGPPCHEAIWDRAAGAFKAGWQPK